MKSNCVGKYRSDEHAGPRFAWLSSAVALPRIASASRKKGKEGQERVVGDRGRVGQVVAVVKPRNPRHADKAGQEQQPRALRPTDRAEPFHAAIMSGVAPARTAAMPTADCPISPDARQAGNARAEPQSKPPCRQASKRRRRDDHVRRRYACRNERHVRDGARVGACHRSSSASASSPVRGCRARGVGRRARRPLRGAADAFGGSGVRRPAPEPDPVPDDWHCESRRTAALLRRPWRRPRSPCL